MSNPSLGLIETWGWVPAVVAADAASKAAMVSLLGYELARAGLVTVKMVGDVAAVKAAVTAGAAAAEKVGKVMAVHVIPRPDRQLWKIQPGPDTLPKPGEPQPSPGPPGGEGNLAEQPGAFGEKDETRIPAPAGESQSPSRPEKLKRGSPKAPKTEKAEKSKPKGGRKREG